MWWKGDWGCGQLDCAGPSNLQHTFPGWFSLNMPCPAHLLCAWMCDLKRLASSRLESPTFG